MHRFKLVALSLLAVFALAAVATSSAMATEPLLLVLAGEKVSELKYEGTGSASKLETVGLKTISCTTTKATATFNAAGTKTADSETGSSTIDFGGCKKEKVGCRSETHTGTKDPVETILTPLALTGASEETSAKELQYILVAKLTESLFLNCGGVKEEIKGSVGCLVSPGLKEVAAGGTVTIACAQKEGKQTTGKCVETATTCANLAKEPLEASLGAGFEGSAEEISVSGTFNKMIFLDD